MQYKEIHDFWFKELSAEERFSGKKEIDEEITSRFARVHKAVAAGECADWRDEPEGAVAEVVVLDQFSRNVFRGENQAFAYDGQALVLAQVAIEKGFDQQLSTEQKLFLYMPFMHSESAAIHGTALELFEALGEPEALKYEKIHKDIIDRFGRYPHRNKQLGRESTQEEGEFLTENTHDFFSS